MSSIAETELILNPDKSVYHLALKGDEIADMVILVGDPERTHQIAKHFDQIQINRQHREFVSCTGWYKQQRITVISTGIGPDNIDIVMNELDAAVNVDPENRTLNPNHRQLTIFRLGTCGALQSEIQVNDIVASSVAIGLDGVLHFYQAWESNGIRGLENAFIEHMNWPGGLPRPYASSATERLLNQLPKAFHKGITITAPGFYGPQGREIQLKCSIAHLNENLTRFRFDAYKILNFEMETSVIYGLAKLLRHECLTLCVAIANRNTLQFTRDYQESVDLLIQQSLDYICNLHES
jgi:uridine phosphorylase